MKATGIVCKIDDLGLVVIPREVRKSLGIKEGDLLDIFIDNGGVCFVPCKDTLVDEVNVLGEKLYNLLKDDYSNQQKIKTLMQQISNIVKEY